MERVYEEIVEFIAAGTTSAEVAAFVPSPAVKERVADLIQKEKEGRLTLDEATELEHFLQLEHLMRLAKAKARTLVAS